MEIQNNRLPVSSPMHCTPYVRIFWSMPCFPRRQSPSTSQRRHSFHLYPKIRTNGSAPSQPLIHLSRTDTVPEASFEGTMMTRQSVKGTSFPTIAENDGEAKNVPESFEKVCCIVLFLLDQWCITFHARRVGRENTPRLRRNSVL